MLKMPTEHRSSIPILEEYAQVLFDDNFNGFFKQFDELAPGEQWKFVNAVDQNGLKGLV
jgi:hypothetical protein